MSSYAGRDRSSTPNISARARISRHRSAATGIPSPIASCDSSCCSTWKAALVATWRSIIRGRSDASLIGIIEQFERTLDPAPDGRRSRIALWLGPALVWGSLAILLLLLVTAGITGLRRLLASHGTPVPLIASNTSAPRFDGWLLETTQSGEVVAFNVATGARHLIVQGVAIRSNQDRNVTVMLSPDHTGILQLISSGSNSDSLEVRFYGLNGSSMNQFTLTDDGFSSNVLGWLNDGRLLISVIPLRNETESNADYTARMNSKGRLIALNLDTGNRQVIANGSYSAANVSPDGKYLALLRNVVSGQSTLEIRPFNDAAVGDTIASAPIGLVQPVGPSVIWTRDSQRIIFASGMSTTQTTTFQSMTLSGTVTSFYSLRNAGFTALIGLTRDGQHLVYVAANGLIGGSPWAYLQVDINGGEPQELSTGGSASTLTAYVLFREPIALVASPDSDAVALTVQLPFSLPQSPQLGSSFMSNVVLAFDSEGQNVGVLLEQFSDLAILGWLPEDAIPPRSTSSTDAKTGQFHEASNSVQGMDEASQITASSQVSPDGTSVLIYDSIYGFSMSAALNDGSSGQAERQPFLQTAGPPADASWMPDGSGAIGVQTTGATGKQTSRIEVYEGQSTDFGVTPTMIAFDPAGLGDNTSTAYHSPLMAPNGLHYSYFVSDEKSVSLWIGGRDQPPKVVASWDLPPNAKIDVSTIAAWIDNSTLIAAEPDNWSSGLPQHVSLQRITLSADGTSTNQPLISWHARGNETGIELRDLRLSPDQSQIALRLRHFTGSNPNSDRFDSIEVADADDLMQSLELARGTSGDGISWSPDNSDLVAVIQGGIKILSPSGGQTQSVKIGDDEQAAYPVWVLPNEIWYEEMDGGQPAHVNELTR